MKLISRWIPALALLLGACASAPRAESAGGAESAFLVRLGNDTLAAERYTRTATRLEGRLLNRSPNATVRDYTATFAPDGTLSDFRTSITRAGESQPYSSAHIRFVGDSALVTVEQGDSVHTMHVAAPHGTIPQLSNSFALYEQATMQARRAGADSVRVPQLPIGGRQTSTLLLQRLGADSMLLTTIAGPMHVRVDRSGRILGASGAGTTYQIDARRLSSLDVDALASAFAAREQQGQALGSLSPLDSVKATVDGAHLEVAYSRPARRGRVVFGNLVPFGQVWRTGANAATVFRTDRALRIGDLEVPAGSYSLWTIPSETQWTLIINRQTGQWGTDYDPARDLGRVALTRTATPAPVERFTIGIEPGPGAQGTLWMSWDDTRVAAPITVLP